MAESDTNTEAIKVDFSQVRQLLSEEQKYYFPHDPEVLPVLHNENVIILQFGGWAVNLYPDGTWLWEDTTGG
jgi:hypothetical protein